MRNYTTIPPKVKRVNFRLTHGFIGGIFVDHLNKDQDKAVDERKMDLRQKDLNKFMETATGQKPKEQTWISLM